LEVVSQPDMLFMGWTGQQERSTTPTKQDLQLKHLIASETA